MTASPSPSPPQCSHRPTCPGCPRYGAPGIAPARQQALERIARECGAELSPVREGDPYGHRHRARLMVRGRPGSPKVGLFQQGSHRIADVPSCPVHHPLVNEAASALRRAMRTCGASPYADGPHRGLVRALQAVVERSTQRVQVVIVTSESEIGTAGSLFDEFERDFSDGLHSLWWNGQPGRSNAILGPHWRRRSGPEAVVEEIGGARIFFPPAAFGQSHLALADCIVAAVHAQVPGGARVAELHAGCGATGLGLVARGHEVFFNEIHPAGVRGLELGIAALPAEARRRCRVVPGSAASCANELSNIDVVLVDPPRKGLEPALADALAAGPPERLVYVSCDLDRFAGDLARLLEPGRLRLRALEPFALFPFTDHVETLAVFERTR